MKSKALSFLSGVLCTLIIIGLPVTALAASNGFTIECYPIKVLVNDEVFQPKDVNGNDVLVFTYNGTTYAPLRALAEAYGLEVGYDGSKNLAAVSSPKGDKPMVSGDFASVWTVKEKPVTMYFSYGQYSLGTAYGFEGYQQSNFKVAGVWIK